MSIAKPLHLRLFLEGIEVPVIAAQVSIGLNAPAAASIQIVPLDPALDLLPRTMVHLFFLDTQTDVGIDASAERGTFQVSPVDRGVRGTYRLLFSGETVGYSFVQTPQSRAFILQCVDFSNYWDSAHATAISYGPGGNLFSDHSALYGGDSSLFDDIINFQADRLVSWIAQRPLTPGLQNISGLAGGVISMMEAMGGVPGHYKGINDFFTIAELRCRLLSQICAEEGDNTAHRVLDEKVFMEWLKNGLQNMGQQVTFRDMMKLLFRYIYYDFVPNPAPKFDEALKGEEQTLKGSMPLASSSAVQTVITDLQTVIEAAVDLAGEAETIKAQGKGEMVSKGHYTLVQQVANKSITALNGLKKTQRQKLADVDTAITKLRHAGDNARKLAGMAKAKAGAVDKQPEAIFEEVVALLQGSSLTVETTRKVITKQSQRLKTQIIRPDCWFVAPPACNVFFPESYSQISYDRNYLAETTRLLIHEFESLVGPEELLANHVLAPNVGFDASKLTRYSGEGSYRILMDHEIHTGILPRTEMLPNTSAAGANIPPEDAKKVRGHRLNWLIKASLFHFFNYRFASRQLSFAGRFNPFAVCGFPGVVITKPYILRGGIMALKKKLLDRNRVDAETLSHIDDKQVVRFLHEYASELEAPSHFVGMIGSLSHNVDQSGGTTSVSMHHVRKHMGIDDEFVGVLLNTEEGTAKRIIRTVLKYSTLANSKDTTSLRALIDATPQVTPPKTSGKSTRRGTRVVENTTERTEADGTTTLTTSRSTVTAEGEEVDLSAPPPLTKVGDIDEASRKGVLIPAPSGALKTGSKAPHDPKGRVVGVEVLDSTLVKVNAKQQVYSAVAVYEEVNVPVSGHLPIEEVLRPTWFSNYYSDRLIGKKIYQPFFGCGSIVDPLFTWGFEEDLQPGEEDASSVVGFEPETKREAIIQQLQADEVKKREVSIEKALNVIGYIYGQVKEQGLDVDSFIRQFTNREIATEEDILGEPGLSFTVAGTAVTAQGAGATPKVGFHSAAVHPALASAGKLTGLLTDLQLELPRIGKQGAPAPVPQKYDVRPAKRLRVQAYADLLADRQAFRG